MALLWRGYLSQRISIVFELMLGSSSAKALSGKGVEKDEIMENSRENVFAGVIFVIKLEEACNFWNFFQKENLAQLFSCPLLFCWKFVNGCF